MGTAETLRAAATGQMSAREARNPYDVLSHQLESRLDEFAKILGSKANAEAYIRVVKNAVLATPDLLNADRQSLLLAAMRAAQDGLMPDGREAVLNIYNTRVKQGDKWVWVKKAQYLPMVGGLIKLMYASGECTYVDAAAVNELDHFKFRRGDNPGIEHEPYDGDEDPGHVKAAYVIVKLKNGEVKREVMFRRDIEKVRAASKAKDDEGNPTGPWKDWYDQQAIKSVIKRVNKQLPKADRLERAIAHDNEEMHGPVVGQAGSIGDLTLVASRDNPLPALEHQPGEILEQSLGEISGGESPEPVQQQAAAQPARTAAKAKGGATDATPKVTYAQLAERLEKCTDGEVAALVLDEGRDLPADQQADLLKLFEKKFPAS